MIGTKYPFSYWKLGLEAGLCLVEIMFNIYHTQSIILYFDVLSLNVECCDPLLAQELQDCW